MGLELTFTEGKKNTSAVINPLCQSNHAGDLQYNLFLSSQQTHSHLLVAEEGQINLGLQCLFTVSVR